MLDVAYHPYDFRLKIQERQIDVLPDRVLIWEIGMREVRIHQHDYRRMLVIPIRKLPSALERNSHGILILGRHKVEQRKGHFLFCRRFRLSFYPERQFRIARHR